MSFKKLLVAAALFLCASPALAQTGVQFTSGTIWGNSTAATRPGKVETVTAIIDRAIGSTRGSILERGASTWGLIAPGTSGLPFVSNGAGADPTYQVLPPAGGGTGLATYAIGDILYASTTSVLSRLADVATGNALISGGVGIAPSWGKIGISTHVSGLGTGVATALGINVGTAGSVVVNGGALGTPSSAGPIVITSNSANAFAVGPNGATNPVLQVDASTGSQAAGLKVTGAASGGTVSISAIDSGSNTNITIGPRGTGTTTIGNASGGAINLTGGPGGTLVNIGSGTSGLQGVAFAGVASGATTLTTLSAASGTLTLPSATDTLVGKATTDIFTNKTYNAQGTGNVFQLSSTTITGLASANQYLAGVSTTDLLAPGVVYVGEQTVTFGATTTFNFQLFNNAVVTLTGNITTQTLSNVTAGKAGSIRFVQDGSGSRTTVWNSTWKWAGGVTPTLTTTAGASDLLSFNCVTTSFCQASLMKDVK